MIIKTTKTMETCKKCDIKFNGTNCPICGKKKSSGGILEGILLVTAIIFATLLISMVGGAFAVLIYLLLYKSINEKYKLLLANTCLVLGIIIGTVIFKSADKVPVEYDTYKFVGIGILAVIGYYSYKFMYKTALNNNNGLWTNVENIVTTKSYIKKNDKDNDDWNELANKINATRDEMEISNQRFEKYLAKCKKDVEAARKQGIIVKDCSELEKYKKRF